MQCFWEESIDVSIQIVNDVKYKLLDSKNENNSIDLFIFAMTPPTIACKQFHQLNVDDFKLNVNKIICPHSIW
jgi:hypothetical protein